MLHIGRETTESPARATRSSVSSTRASGWRASEQQCPTRMRPLEAVAQRSRCDPVQRNRLDGVGLVGMEIEVRFPCSIAAAKTRSTSASRSGTM